MIFSNEMLMYYSKDNIDKYGVKDWNDNLVSQQNSSRAWTFMNGYEIVLNFVFLDRLKQ